MIKSITFVLDKQLSYIIKKPNIMEIQNILEVMTNGSEVIKNIQNRFFEVVKEPVTFANGYEAPKDMYGVFNAKTKKSLSLKSMGKNFVPMQQQELLDNILATIHEFQADLDINTLQFNTYCGGSNIEFTIETKPLKFLNAKSIMDETNIMLSFTTSYDGSKSNRYALFTNRVVCENGMTVSEFQGDLKGRNTLGGKTKILSYAQELAEIINGAELFKEKMQKLDKIKISKKQVEAFKLSLFGFNTETLNKKAKEQTENDKKDTTAIQRNLLANFDNGLAIEFAQEIIYALLD